MKRVITLLLLLFLLPTAAFASCSNEGFTVILVNGILTSEEKAKAATGLLQRVLGSKFGKQDLIIQNGYNPSHLAGAADAAQSVFQAFNNPVSDFDLNTILMQVRPQVTTRKILLLGHSQGSFYVNEMYKYLRDNGVPQESIAVYQIATPSSYVAGGGQYVTSTNDKAMNLARNTAIGGNVNLHLESRGAIGSVVNSALRANITIPKESGYEDNDWGGHHFNTYMEGAADRIVRDISAELSYLKTTETATSTEGCFTAPVADIKYKMQAAAFNSLDPLASNIKNTASFFKGAVSGAVSFVSDFFSSSSSPTAPKAPQIAAAVLAIPTPQAQAPKIPVVPKPTDTLPIVTSSPKINTETLAAKPVTRPVENTPAPVVTDAPIAPVPVPTNPWPGYGGGGGSAIAPPVLTPSSPTPIVLTVGEPLESAHIATSTITFSGSTAPSALVSVAIDTALATTAADGAGNWSVQVSVPEGSQSATIQSDLSGVLSALVSRVFVVDTTAPAIPTLVIDDCTSSIVAGMCVLVNENISLSWQVDTGAAYYAIFKNDIQVGTTTQVVVTQDVVQNATTSFAVVAFDTAGNIATSTSVSVGNSVQPIIINEVAWAGDDTSASNQWIELKNMSPYTIDLSRFTITRTGGDVIPLSGSIAAGGYVVVEPHDAQYTGSNKIIVPFGALSTLGEELALTVDGISIDSTPMVATCSGWCAGAVNVILGSNVSGVSDLSSSLSMERAKNSADGTLLSSWHSTDGYGPWLGKNVALWGTPGQENSEGWPEAGVVCDASGPLTPNQPAHPSSSCIVLMKFITGSTPGPARYAGVFRGDVGTSTGSMNFHSKKLAVEVPFDFVDPQEGEHFYFAAIELRSWANDVFDFMAFFTDGSQVAPHGNYIVVPFTYSP